MKWSSILGCGMILSSLAMGQSIDPDLPKKVVPAAPVLEDSAVDAAELEAAIKGGVDFLLKDQNPDGSWGNATRTKGLNIFAPIPGAHHAFRMGTTSLALAGMIQAKDERPEVTRAIDKCEKWMLETMPKLRRAGGSTIYNNWGHAYGLRALVALAQRDGMTEEKMLHYTKLAQSQVDALWVNQDLDGGWGYYGRDSVTAQPSGGSTSFTTATVILAIKEAAGVFDLKLDDRRLKLAVLSIQRQRTPDFAYTYATGHIKRPRYSINRPAGSLARTTACNAALREWGDEKITDEVLVMGLDRMIKRNGWLDIGRKRPKPHETHFAISGYFYFYGHYYASENILQLPESKQGEWKAKLAKVMLDKQESDGSWWDYALYNYGHAYGTGYALTTLTRCR
ncbi:hypothetical protein [Rubritalea tangerina]|uniref:Squalene cyclase C-terminal domain-containing protein n=1 Tax=Rubritalea tangerina TaxID=430798 RepID=A0ABW4Z6Q0_9BACT